MIGQRSLFSDDPLEMCTDLDQLKELNLQCRRCGLRDGCNGVVFGKGNPRARLMLIGEGPGAEEDRQGLPFVGAAGQLLDKILAAAEIPVEEVYIANIVKCRPPNNRVPTREEMDACLPWLWRQIELISPAIIVLLGSTALQGLVDPKGRITRVRGQWLDWNGIKVMPTYHPAALLRDPSKKKPAWEDFKKVRDLYRQLKEREARLNLA
ncbi:MAG: uracil-DNA glycosylase [Eubacteriales bacterium]|nr:uracil-DNA glycosylase [Eubacteriales bacterium]MDN5363192.1 uracil-DNA glycosylase [Eubacteriales bacterium]